MYNSMDVPKTPYPYRNQLFIHHKPVNRLTRIYFCINFIPIEDIIRQILYAKYFSEFHKILFANFSLLD